MPRHGLLIIDKEAGMTSHAVVVQVRKLTDQRKIGHTGTLDPEATGVLPLCLGEATKIVPFLLEADKEYAVELILGTVTDTQDATGKVLQSAPVLVTEAELRQVLPRFLGKIQQIPPMTSALHYQGRRLYKLAHAGLEVERAPREVEIKELELTGWQPPDRAYLRVVCSKGTYIRTLCHDLGQALGCGGHMGTLRRLRTGPFTLSQAHTLTTIANAIQENRLEELLLPLQAALPHLPVLTLTQEENAAIRHGQSLKIPKARVSPSSPPSSPSPIPLLLRLEDFQGKLVAIGQGREITPPKTTALLLVQPQRVFNY